MQSSNAEAVALRVAFGFIVVLVLFMAGVGLFYHESASTQDVENCIEGTIPADLNTGKPIRERCITIPRKQIDEGKCRVAQREVNQQKTAVADLNARLIELSVVVKTEYQTSAEQQLKDAQQEAEELCYFLTPTIEPTSEISSPTPTNKSVDLTINSGDTPSPTPSPTKLISTSTSTPTMTKLPSVSSTSVLPTLTQIPKTVAPTMVVASPTPLEIPIVIKPITATPTLTPLPSFSTNTPTPIPNGEIDSSSLSETETRQSVWRRLNNLWIAIAGIIVVGTNFLIALGLVLKYTRGKKDD